MAGSIAGSPRFQDDTVIAGSQRPSEKQNSSSIARKQQNRLFRFQVVHALPQGVADFRGNEVIQVATQGADLADE